MKNKVLILIDGSNFYFKLKEIGLKKTLKFNFNKFANFLAVKDIIVGRRYYVGRIRQDGSKKTEELFKSQQKLIAHLKKNKFQYRFGYLMKSDGKYHEKGVDVQMAVDIVSSAYEKDCKKIILVSSDTDLSPAIRKAIQKGLIVEYIGFSHNPSIAMVSFCSKSRLLTKDEIKGFII